ncbi:hypothetical protein BGW38_007767 [Lunasporangiospora selenospora]|uniref:Dolichyl-phosphate-mannose--protein mannosyltransferase n=1 Tax=Lunasporangiospora selenospora TaxID=979761 RepID=A0A9P6FZ00_9FUNG|nr:hypothetical protein BGW38_007767 [Lunasporangiospora selenospora]
MPFGGYNPTKSKSPELELPFTAQGSGASGTASPLLRSRSSSSSSIHSDHSNHHDHGQPSHTSQQSSQRRSPYHSTYSSQPGTPGGPVKSSSSFPSNQGSYFGYSSAGGYEGYGLGLSSSPSTPRQQQYDLVTAPVPLQQLNQHQHYSSAYDSPGLAFGSGGSSGIGGIDSRRTRGSEEGYSSGYDSPTGVSTSIPYTYNSNTSRQALHQAQQPHPYHQGQQYHRHRHNRAHSNASETSLSIDTDLVGLHEGDKFYSPGLASLSSTGSPLRDTYFGGSGGAGSGAEEEFYARRGPTFQPGLYHGASNVNNGDRHSYDLGGTSGNRKSPRHTRQKKLVKRTIGSRMGRMGGFLNDWDLLPSSDAYDIEDEDNQYDDEDCRLTENERWKRQQVTKKGWESSKGQGIILALLVSIAVVVRIWKVAIPAAVVRGEEESGRFIRSYLNSEFHMDAHPPLGKILFAILAYLCGIDVNFDFELGSTYPSKVSFISLRLFSALCGVGLVPISYLTIKNSGHSTQAAMICAIMVTLENALITQSRFILLDSQMMLFMGFTVLSWVNFYNHRNRPFTRGWWYWLLSTGIGIFLSSSVKWVGLFTAATVGLCMTKYLHESRKHLYITTRDFSKQLIALCICLVLIPFALYMGVFAIEFKLLSKSGPGNLWVSPQFQTTLQGHYIHQVMADVAWGSKIHIRHANTNGGWLQSAFELDAHTDQATQLVGWDDITTCWTVLPRPLSNSQSSSTYNDMFQGYVYDGDIIHLQQCFSTLSLVVHDQESAGSNKSFIREVRGAQMQDMSLPSAAWKVELVPDGLVPGLASHQAFKETDQETDQQKPSGGATTQDGPRKDPTKQWHSIKGFRLYNEQQKCYLMSHKVMRSAHSTHQEVGCIQGNKQMADTIFVVDRNFNPCLPPSTNSLSYQPLGFFQKFLEVNRVMWWTHQDLNLPAAALTPGDFYIAEQNNKNSMDESSPWSWPFLSRGLMYYSNKETNQYVYLLGNPLLWWASTATSLLYMAGCVRSAARYFSGRKDTKVERSRFVSKLDRSWQGWSSTKLRALSGWVLVALIVASWFSLSPLAYGTDFSSKARCEKARSIGGWEFVCQRQNLSPKPGILHQRSLSERGSPNFMASQLVDNTLSDNQPIPMKVPVPVSQQNVDSMQDLEGPYNDGQKEHYEHDHFRHPHTFKDEHGHGHEIHSGAHMADGRNVGLERREYLSEEQRDTTLLESTGSSQPRQESGEPGRHQDPAKEEAVRPDISRESVIQDIPVNHGNEKDKGGESEPSSHSLVNARNDAAVAPEQDRDSHMTDEDLAKIKQREEDLHRLQQELSALEQEQEHKREQWFAYLDRATAVAAAAAEAVASSSSQASGEVVAATGAVHLERADRWIERHMPDEIKTGDLQAPDEIIKAESSNERGSNDNERAPEEEAKGATMKKQQDDEHQRRREMFERELKHEQEILEEYLKEIQQEKEHEQVMNEVRQREQHEKELQHEREIAEEQAKEIQQEERRRQEEEEHRRQQQEEEERGYERCRREEEYHRQQEEYHRQQQEDERRRQEEEHHRQQQDEERQRHLEQERNQQHEEPLRQEEEQFQHHEEERNRHLQGEQY